MSSPIDQNLGETKQLVSSSTEEHTVDAETNTQNSDELLSELRHLLIAPEQKQLSNLTQRLNDPDLYAQDISNILPKAISLSAKNGLTEALQPAIETAIKISVKKDPSTLVDALFPVMGPAIRKAISQALSSMLQSLNQTLESSFSVQGLKWRLESIRTGRSFAEIVLLHTLLYRVEQVFLIHKETGLLLQHLIAPTIVAQDADMVSGMLSAIQDFARDSFGVNENETLQELKVGELTVWIEQGPKAFLAGVLRGNAPKELRPVFQEALEQVHLKHTEQLTDFQGDAAIFEATRPLLETCLQTQYEFKSEEKKSSPLLPAIAGTMGVLLLIWLGYGYWHYWHWQNYLARLNSEPGIVVTRTGSQNGKYFVAGLLDPLAINPEEIRKEIGLNPNKVLTSWEPYQALQPKFILQRAKIILDPPQTVTLRLENNTLIASGSASQIWIRETSKWARVIAGINSFQADKLISLEEKELEESKAFIEEQRLLFLKGKTQLTDGQEKVIENLILPLQELIEKAKLVNKKVKIEILGQTDAIGTEETNSSLSRERAEKIASLLTARGINSNYLTTKGIGVGNALTNESVSLQNNEANRRVIFRVNFLN